MMKILCFILCYLVLSNNAYAASADYFKYYKVDMQMELPDYDKYIQKLKTQNAYDSGYNSRFQMGTVFKKEFGKVIKAYGSSEARLKSYYEDDLLMMIKSMPQSSYQYIGPMLHEVPGMSEKILNLPGIKETKNQFPKDVAEKLQDIENLEFLSPALYFALMPQLWEKQYPEDKPELKKVKNNKPRIELPDFLKKQIGLPVKQKEKPTIKSRQKNKLFSKLKTIHPTLTSPLTTKDVDDFVGTLDDIIVFGNKNNKQNYIKLIITTNILNMWEAENQTALTQNILKDIVNPCQRLVVKIRLANLYDEFEQIVAKKGFTPEEWGYTCDKTIKALRVVSADLDKAYAVSYHRKGYYQKYISKLPKKWQDIMYATEAAIIRMYAVNKDDIEIVREFKDKISQKLFENDNNLLASPIIY